MNNSKKNNRLSQSFFNRDVLDVAPDLLGKILVRKFEDGRELKYQITEVEAYRGEEDLACHARKGKTKRTEAMYNKGGTVYVYLVYGMYWMLNFVTGKINNPQAILIRGIQGINGPGKITKQLQIDKSFYNEDLSKSKRIWVQESNQICNYKTAPRIGIEYAGEKWKNKPWRFILT